MTIRARLLADVVPTICGVEQMLSVTIYADRKKVATATLFGERLSSDVMLTDRNARPRLRDCRHATVERAYAYVAASDVHWPISYCGDCRTVLTGRVPYPADLHRPAWKRDDAEWLAARRWAEKWPKSGRPRSKRPRLDTA
jgi:hypothetical protein